MAFEAEIRNYIETEILRRTQEDFSDDRPLIRDGLLNSIGVMKLITFMSDHLNVELEDDDFRMENFETINRIGELLERKLVKVA